LGLKYDDLTDEQEAWIEEHVSGEWEITCRGWASWEDDQYPAVDEYADYARETGFHHPECQCARCFYGEEVFVHEFQASEY
jgi:hypothetical protein